MSSSVIILLLIILTCLTSYRGFTDHRLVDKYSFDVDQVSLRKDYKRLVTSGFFHVNWFHLIFNMLTFYFFSQGVATVLGMFSLLIIYFAGLIGGNLVGLWIHRKHGGYRSIGASGAVYAIIFASVALFPGMKISLFFILSLPTWIYGLLFLGFTLYGIRSKTDNIGHEAHLGGALVGMLIAIILYPSTIEENYLPILAVLIPALALIYIIMYKPQMLMVDNLHFKKTHPQLTIDQKFNLEKKNQQLTIDRILEKIHQKGIKSLTAEEKKKLEEFSKKQG
jgi:membrane associated rhomboid family serine protease